MLFNPLTLHVFRYFETEHTKLTNIGHFLIHIQIFIPGCWHLRLKLSHHSTRKKKKKKKNTILINISDLPDTKISSLQLIEK